MENTSYSSTPQGLSFSETVKSQLASSANWAGIAAILSMVSAVISAIVTFVAPKETEAFRTEGFRTDARIETAGNIFGVIFSLGINFVLFYFLYRFARQVKTGLSGNNQDLINSGLGGLSTYFILIGVVMILILAVAFFAIIGVAIGVGAGAI